VKLDFAFRRGGFVKVEPEYPAAKMRRSRSILLNSEGWAWAYT